MLKVQASLAKSVTFPQRLIGCARLAMLADCDYLNDETVRMDGAIRTAHRVGGDPG
ncbi:hypothetical protein ACQP04_24645 [Pseudonocardia halophobica]|uniref:hypothetical protein n=1 Tax=Pseudonocardia halophobica TaxID=29401 RepID=UPI003D944FBF